MESTVIVQFVNMAKFFVLIWLYQKPQSPGTTLNLVSGRCFLTPTKYLPLLQWYTHLHVYVLV